VLIQIVGKLITTALTSGEMRVSHNGRLTRSGGPNRGTLLEIKKEFRPVGIRDPTDGWRSGLETIIKARVVN
jgi:hypothetical protein